MNINHRLGTQGHRNQPLNEGKAPSKAEARQVLNKAIDKLDDKVDDARKVLGKAIDKLEDAGKKIMGELPWVKDEGSSTLDLEDSHANGAGQASGQGQAARGSRSTSTIG